MPFTRTDDGPLAVLTLDHGDLNLFDRSVFDSLEREVRTLADTPPRGLLIEARGRVVSAGVDVNAFEGLKPESAGALWARLLDTIHTLESLPCPARPGGLRRAVRDRGPAERRRVVSARRPGQSD